MVGHRGLGQTPVSILPLAPGETWGWSLPLWAIVSASLKWKWMSAHPKDM